MALREESGAGGPKMSRQQQSRGLDERNNPCVKEHHSSQRCLDRNNYDYSKCEAFFENYRRCKKFWGEIRAQRRRAGIRPHIPPPEERVEIKRKHMEGELPRFAM